MPAADRSLDIVAFVSEHFRDILRRRLSELAGLALLTLTLLGAIALATWSVQDPSLSHATQKPIHNLLGYPGAIFADLAMQLLGLAAVMLLLPMMVLGWTLLTHRPLRREMPRAVVDARHRPVRRLRRDAAAHRLLAAADRPRRRRRRCAAAPAALDRLAADLFVLIVLSPLLGARRRCCRLRSPPVGARRKKRPAAPPRARPTRTKKTSTTKRRAPTTPRPGSA